MSLQYVKGTRLWLKGHPEFSEAWLRDLIANPGEVAENEKLLKSLLRAAYKQSPELSRKSPAQIAMWPEGNTGG